MGGVCQHSALHSFVNSYDSPLTNMKIATMRRNE